MSTKTTRKVADMTQQERAAELREIAARSPATLARELVRLADMIDPVTRCGENQHER